MRQLQVQVRKGNTDRVLELAAEHGAPSPTVVPGTRAEGEDWSVVLLHLPNERVGTFMKAVEVQEDAQAVLFPQGILPIQPPLDALSQQTADVSPRSTLELVIGALQSMGSWKGMLLYAAFSGLVAAYAVMFNVMYLLVAAMLIAPMGAPAMVSAIGASIGDWRMVGRGAVRFVASIGVLIACAIVLGYIYGLSVTTHAMLDIVSYSNWIVLLALVGGGAGAQSQVLASRDSLVSGTTAGFLVAVALSPPSAVLGLAVILGNWAAVGSMAFLLVLTFFGIIASGALLLRFYGVRPKQPSAERGSRLMRTVLLAATLVLVVGLVAWQSQQAPRFQKADVAYRAVELAREAGQAVEGAQLVDVTTRFVSTNDPGVEPLLVSVVVDRAGEPMDTASLEAAVREAIVARFQARLPGVRPHVQVTIVP